MRDTVLSGNFPYFILGFLYVELLPGAESLLPYSPERDILKRVLAAFQKHVFLELQELLLTVQLRLPSNQWT